MEKRFAIIPSVEIKDERCPMCIQGAHGTETFYYGLSEHPLDICRLLRLENAKTMLIDAQDLDFSSKSEYYHDLINQIFNATRIAIQFKANFENIGQIEEFIDRHLALRVIVNANSFPDYHVLQNIIEDKGASFICMYAKFKKGIASLPDRKLSNVELMKEFANIGVDRVLYHELDFETGTDYASIAALASETNLKITLFDNVDSPEELWRVSKYKDLGIDSAVIGLPLYENSFPCQQLWRLAECG
ncbi:MAG: HisA/HisF-related TIM barrel protein [Candidatus Kapabacteria bacterium]|nr:HisA/HisF-related TIM barrel protein [Candidatus Kapabacteria bacterium]